MMSSVDQLCKCSKKPYLVWAAEKIGQSGLRTEWLSLKGTEMQNATIVRLLPRAKRIQKCPWTPNSFDFDGFCTLAMKLDHENEFSHFYHRSFLTEKQNAQTLSLFWCMAKQRWANSIFTNEYDYEYIRSKNTNRLRMLIFSSKIKT